METRRIRGALLKVFLLLGSVCVGLLAIEGGARLYVAVAKPQLADYYAFMKSAPPPYRGASFYSMGYVDEYIRDEGYYTPRGTRLVIPLDRRGEYINVTAGRRHTTLQPEFASNTVYVLGGSTILGREVPDDQTIPSHLQRSLLERFGDLYRVENIGTVSVNARQQLERLKTLDLHPGDVVLFYDGVNEIYHSLYFNNPEGWTVQDHLRDRSALPWHRRWVFDLYDRLYHKSIFVTYFLNPYDTDTVPDHLADPLTLERLLANLETGYVDTITEAGRYCAERGVTFHHFLQPNLFTVEDRSEYEEQLLASRYFTANGLDIAFTHGHPLLQRVVGELASTGLSSTDLSTVLNDRPSGEEYYLDFCHVNHRANSVVAESIASVAFAPVTTARR